MTDRSLYLVRHGERLDALDKNWYSSDDNKYDPPLSETGFEQAQRLAERLKQEAIDYIFVSPYLRALQTAHPIAEALDLPLYVENGVGEWLGRSMIPHEPKITAPYQRREDFPQLDFSHNPRVIPHWPETVTQCFERLNTAVGQLFDAYKGNILIVGHGRTVTGIAHMLTGKPESHFKYNLASVTKLDYEDEQWAIRLNADTVHLEAETVPQFV
jgi:broad specificity phosphatase PhoE